MKMGKSSIQQLLMDDTWEVYHDNIHFVNVRYLWHICGGTFGAHITKKLLPISGYTIYIQFGSSDAIIHAQ